MQILEQMWYEGIHPSERPLRLGGEREKADGKWSDSEKKLMNMLDEVQKAAFEAYMDDYSSVNAAAECRSFASGFRLGARVMIDVLQEKEINE